MTEGVDPTNRLLYPMRAVSTSPGSSAMIDAKADPRYAAILKKLGLPL